MVESLLFLALLLFREMRTHLRRVQKGCPTPNRDQLRVLLYRGRKNWLYFEHFTTESPIENWFVVGPLFWATSRRRCVRISRILYSFCFGFLQTARHNKNSTIPARLQHESQHCQNGDDS